MFKSSSTTLYSRATFLTPAFAFDLESSDFLSNFSCRVRSSSRGGVERTGRTGVVLPLITHVAVLNYLPPIYAGL